MYNYCTLFDSNYLTRGLAMYESLKKYSDKFHLFIFAFDLRSYEMLNKLNLKSVTIISLKEFENEELLEIKKNRSQIEYCWTCTPYIIQHSIEKFNLKNCTYLDADIYFFSNPNILIKEMLNKSILLTEHRYSSNYDQSLKRGIYNVQFLTFKNDKNGMKALNWWKESCKAWCYQRVENEKFGDQKYLDDWTLRFDGVHVLKNLGGGVAPWNIQKYKIEETVFQLVFYHFHGFKYLLNDKVDLGTYRLRKEDIKYLYKPYLKHLENINKNIFQIDSRYDFNGTMKQNKMNFKNIFRFIKRKINRSYNIYDKYYILGL